MATMRGELYRVTDVIEALRDELALLEEQLDRDGEPLRMDIEAVEVELQVVVAGAAKVGGKASAEGAAKIGLEILGLVKGKGGLELTGEKGWSDALTQTVRLKLKPHRVTERERKLRQAAPGKQREVKTAR